MTLWTAQEAAQATGGTVTSDWAVNGVSIDTRTLQAGDLFVALKAARDGHDFVAQALAKGATAALVSHVPEDVAEDAPLLIVPDVLEALEAMGEHARTRTNAHVVAVTGSVGKTSTKEMLRDVLSQQGKTHAAEASYNNHWGVPLTLARMPEDADYAVIEIGMNHPGEIAPLARMARPHVAMITTVAAAHLEAFEDIEGIAHEKAAIFEGLGPGGTAVINADIDTADIVLAAAQAKGANIKTFGQEGGYTLSSLRFVEGCTVVEADIEGTPLLYKINSMGRHFAMNGLGVLACVDALGGDRALAAIGMGQWQPPAGRGTRETLVLDADDEALTFDLIDDAFNANPTSMAAALEVLAASKPRHGVGRIQHGRRIAVLGDMLELGPDEMALHADLAELSYMDQLDVVHCVGPRMRTLWSALPATHQGEWVENAEALVQSAHRMIDAGDIVLVKGSKGSRVSLIVEALRNATRPQPADGRDD